MLQFYAHRYNETIAKKEFYACPMNDLHFFTRITHNEKHENDISIDESGYVVVAYATQAATSCLQKSGFFSSCHSIVSVSNVNKQSV